MTRLTRPLITSLISVSALVLAAWPMAGLAGEFGRPPLGTAGNFAVLAGETVTNTGPTTISGQVGLSPGTSVTGFPPGLSGVRHVANPTAVQAKDDLTTAYLDAKGQTPCTPLTGDLGGRSLNAGLYCYTSDALLTGTLTLTGEGPWVFQIGSKLTTASNSTVSVIDATQACDVFWQIGSSATLGTNTAFVGTIMALTSIALQTGARIVPGRALAQNGAVTLDTNTITQPTGCGYAAPSPPFGGALTVKKTCDAGVTGTAAFTIKVNGTERPNFSIQLKCGDSFSLSDLALGDVVTVHEIAALPGGVVAPDQTVTITREPQTLTFLNRAVTAAPTPAPTPTPTPTAARLAVTGGGQPPANHLAVLSFVIVWILVSIGGLLLFRRRSS